MIATVALGAGFCLGLLGFWFVIWLQLPSASQRLRGNGRSHAASSINEFRCLAPPPRG
jgi:hypothetical protein